MIPIGDSRRAPIFPVAVYTIIALNVLVFIAEVSSGKPDVLINAFALIPYDVTHQVVLAPPSPPTPYLTLLTAQFLHGSLLHIFFNMLFLMVFGPDVEYLCGSIRFVGFYLACGILGGVAQIVMGPGSHVPEIGASGAIAGVLGAYIINFPRNSIETIVPIGCFPLLLRLPAILVIGVWAATQFIHGFGTIDPRTAMEQGGGIAYFAHIGGFLAGIILIGPFRVRAKQPTRRYRYYY